MGNGSEKKQISSRERPFPEEKERGVLEEYLLRGRRIVKRSIGDGDGDASMSTPGFDALEADVTDAEANYEKTTIV